MAETPRVIVKPLSTKPKARYAVEILMTDDNLSEQRDLFLRGFSAVQQKDLNDPTSFYQIAGIHGLPYEPYDGVVGTYEKKNPGIQWGGYCRHGDILFPTWHRPYIMLLEQCIYEEAKILVNSDADYRKDPRYTKALEELRFPYWDWASPSTLSHGVPSFFFRETIRVAVNIENDNTKKHAEIPNPLRAYTLPKNLGRMSLVGDQGNPTQRPYVPPRDAVPYTPEGFATVRHPSSDYLSQVDQTSLDVIQDCSTTFRPNLYQVFLVKDWRKFSNHGWGDDPDHKVENDYGNSASIEVVHDALHVSVAGNGGHMGQPDIAAFDPIFFLHHCNVDRLVAIWQACHPKVWIKKDNQTSGTFTDPPNETIDANTDLTPFRKSIDKFWNSNDVRDIKKLGYTYTVLEKKYDSENGLLKEMLDYYHPNRYLETHWQVQIRVKKGYLGYPFLIRVFFDKSNASADTPTSSPNYAGYVYVFTRGKNTLCANCRRNPNMVVNGAVDLTVPMQRLGILEQRGTVEGNRVTLVAVRLDGTGIPLNEIGLKLADIYKIQYIENNFKYTFVNHVELPPNTLHK